MGFITRLSTVVSPPALRATTFSEYNQAFFGGDPLPDLWLAALSGSGISVSPDLAMTLAAYRCGVTTIAYDLATLPLRAFKARPDGGADLLNAGSPAAAGIAALMYRLQWQPNKVQTATEFIASLVLQYKMRNRAFAEIVPGPSGFADQLLPRHPDRVTKERMPDGTLRFRLQEANGLPPRFLTQDEMFFVQDISTDGGLSTLSSIGYAANMVGTALAAERAAGRFFRTGMTAALLATYTGGEMDDEAERDLHASISRYAAGVENSFGLMLVPDDIKITNLAIAPEKAQMMEARGWTIYEVARDLRISPRKLMVGKESTYASAYQDAIDHVVNCLRPIAVLFQQSVQRDLVLQKDMFRFVFHLGELLKGDPTQMGAFIAQLVASRTMTPSEIRMTYLDLNPDPHLDLLSESDNKPGSSAPKPAPEQPPASEPHNNNAALFRAWGFVRDAAERCVRRERMAVEKLALKHASDVNSWQLALRDFYAEHAQFIAQTMRLPIGIARGIAALHGTAFEESGVALIKDDAGPRWEREEADALAAIAATYERVA